MGLKRFYTKSGVDVYAEAKFRTVTDDAWQEHVVPQFWGRAAIDILLNDVFGKEAIPAITTRAREEGIPDFLQSSIVDEEALDGISAEGRFRYERDIREVLNRVSGALGYHGWKQGLFADEEEARIFYDELRHILLHQIAVVELPMLQSFGLDWAYGLLNARPYLPHHRIAGFSTTLLDVAGAGGAFPADEDHLYARLKILAASLSLQGSHARITLPAEHAESLSLIDWKREEELLEATEALGRKTLKEIGGRLMDACDRDGFFGFDPARNRHLAAAIKTARDAGVSEAAIRLAISYAEQGYEEMPLPFPPEETRTADALRVTLSVPDELIEAAMTGHGFLLGAEPRKRHMPAEDLWEHMAKAIWATGEPTLLFRGTVEENNILPQAAVLDETGGFLFAPRSEAVGATINLLSVARGDGIVDLSALSHVTEILTHALDAALSGMKASPRTLEYRPMAIGLANLPMLLMGKALAYDSDAGRSVAALLSAFVTGKAAALSASFSARLGACPAWPYVEKKSLQGIKDKIAALSGTLHLQRGVTRRPLEIKTALCPDRALVEATEKTWAEVYAHAKETGLRNIHLTALAPAPVIDALLGAQTEGIMPAPALVRFEGYFSDTLETAELYGKKLNPMVPAALMRLGYPAAAIEDIYFYAVGHGTLLDAPFVNHDSLRQKSFARATIDAIEAALTTAQHIRYAFNKWTLGEDFCRRVLGFSAADLEDPHFDMLTALGFQEDEIDAANLYCCGTMTLEGAPHLKTQHLPIFDCVAPAGAGGIRRVSAEAQVKMQAAIETFLSGAVSHTVMLSHHTTIEDVKALMLKAWELGVRHARFYREGCSLLQPYVLPLRQVDEADSEPFVPQKKKAALSG